MKTEKMLMLRLFFSIQMNQNLNSKDFLKNNTQEFATSKGLLWMPRILIELR